MIKKYRNDDDAIGNEHEHKIVLLKWFVELFLGIHTDFFVFERIKVHV